MNILQKLKRILRETKMPNWTDNLLIIDGPVENVKTFFTELSSKNNLLTELMPIPDELKNIHQGSR